MKAAPTVAALAVLSLSAAAQTAGEAPAEPSEAPAAAAASVEAEAAAEAAEPEPSPEQQRIAELEAQLAAQQEMNALLKQRIRTLEGEVAAAAGAPGEAVIARRPVAVASADPAPENGIEEEEERALERALVRRGTAVLPPWKAEIAPAVSWTHSGSGDSRQDSYSASIDGRLGLPGGWMVGAGVPVQHRDVEDRGENTGLGDARLAVWKSLMVQDEGRPSIVGSLQYRAPTGEDFTEDDVPTGSGFHSVSGTLSAVKSIDPIAFFGSASYGYAFEESFDGEDRRPGDAIGVGVGASLAVTPEISLTSSVDFTFTDDFEIDGAEIDDTSGTFGSVGIGAGVLLTRGVFLSLSGDFGITDESPDVSVGVALPIRF